MAPTASELQLPLKVDELIAVLRRHGVTEASVFGSYARGSARPHSDLDLLITFSPDSDPWEFLALQEELNSLTNLRA